MLESVLETHLLDIGSISSSVARSTFTKANIDQLAQNFLQTGGSIRPLVVKRTDLEEFAVVHGHLEFYAAVRAREIDDDFELIRGIILNKKNEALILKQYKQVYGEERSPAVAASDSTTAPVASAQISGLADFEKNLMAHVQDTLKFEVDRLKLTITKDLEAKFNGVRILIPNDQDHLDLFNHAEPRILENELARVKFGNSKLSKVVTAIIQERKKGEFTSFTDVVRRVRITKGKRAKKYRAITEESMLKILDAWNSFVSTKSFK